MAKKLSSVILMAILALSITLVLFPHAIQQAFASSTIFTSKDSVYDAFSSLCVKYPRLVCNLSLGNSVDGHAIWAYRLGIRGDINHDGVVDATDKLCYDKILEEKGVLTQEEWEKQIKERTKIR